MELESSLPCSQKPATGHYAKPDELSSHPVFWSSIFLLASHLRLGLPRGLILQAFKPTVRIYPMCATYPLFIWSS
jgi:hypothetical protein